jgi:hypothetical protein
VDRGSNNNTDDDVVQVDCTVAGMTTWMGGVTTMQITLSRRWEDPTSNVHAKAGRACATTGKRVCKESGSRKVRVFARKGRRSLRNDREALAQKGGLVR